MPTAVHDELVPSDSVHAFQAGDEVFIISLALFGRPYIEGRAHIETPFAGVRDLYFVRFIGDTRLRERYVFPEYQADPHRMLGILLDTWRASLVPEILTEFFPDDHC
jgi:hypothetical protein